MFQIALTALLLSPRAIVAASSLTSNTKSVPVTIRVVHSTTEAEPQSKAVPTHALPTVAVAAAPPVIAIAQT